MITDDIMNQVESVTEYLNDVVKLIKKSSLPVELQKVEESEAIAKLEPKELKKYLKVIEYLKKVHVPIIYNTALKAIQNNVSVKDFAKFVSKFFENVPSRYKRFAESDSASSGSVKIRVEEMDKSLVDEFKIVEKVAEIQPEVQNPETIITADQEDFSEEIQPEQIEEIDLSNENQEDAQTILNIVDNVA